MREITNRQKLIILSVMEGIIAFLLCFLPFMRISVWGVGYNVGYLNLVGAVLHIADIPGLAGFTGEDWMFLLFYTSVITGVIVLAVIMAVKAYREKGRIIFLVGNVLVFLLTFFVRVYVNTFFSSIGIGYTASMFLAIAGFVLGIINMKNGWTVRKAGAERASRDGFADRKKWTSVAFKKKDTAYKDPDTLYRSADYGRRTESGPMDGRTPGGRGYEAAGRSHSHVARPRGEAHRPEPASSRPFAPGMEAGPASSRPSASGMEAGPASPRSSAPGMEAGPAPSRPSASRMNAEPHGPSSHDAPYKTDPSSSTVKVKYNMKNSKNESEETSEFFHREDDLL